MSRSFPGLLLCAAVLVAAPPDPSAQARSAVAGLAEKLKTLLGEELAKGGFEGAVHACSTSAQKVTRDFAAQAGVDIRRVTLKHRNPANAPDAWERAQLARMEADLRAGKPLPAEVWEVVDEPPVAANTKSLSNRERREPGSANRDAQAATRYHRLMKPILIQGMCISCHGSAAQIPDPVKKQIAKSYHQDLATGYKAGELRGAFSVKIPVRAPQAQ
jgi:hypothetical protein